MKKPTILPSSSFGPFYETASTSDCTALKTIQDTEKSTVIPNFIFEVGQI
jgi:hypothetical protein